LRSQVFVRSSRLSRFLHFAVDQTLCGKQADLKEQLIGREVFDRKTDYDPRIDPIVRVEARRLRVKLRTYYTSSGRGDRIWIAFPKGTYAPVFRFRQKTRAVRPKANPPSGPSSEKSVAVLPFSNLTPDAGDDYFSDGLTEELIHLLTRIPRFRVVAWNSASQLRGREQDLAGIRQQLKVGTVLRGSVRRTASRVRVNAQLIDAETGAYLWSEAYDHELRDVFALQEEMARAIVSALHLTLTSREPTAPARRLPHLRCYNFCLQGRFHANKRTREGLRKSVSCYQQAIAADDSCADAHAGLADAYSLLADYGLLNPANAMPKARAAAEKALALDSQSAEANVSLAFIRTVADWDWAGAESLYRRAIELNPGYSRARHWFGLDHLALLGRFDEAMSEVRAAHDLDPLSLIIREGCGYMHTLRREYAQAIRVYQELLELDGTFYKAHSSMGRALCLMERYDEALEAFETARTLAGNVPNILSALGQTLALAGHAKEARKRLKELQALADKQWVPSVCFAILYLGLGEYHDALNWLEAATERREIAVTALKVHPMYDPLRAEPRFATLLTRIKFLP
jgi:serine/threonine-protein kinase